MVGKHAASVELMAGKEQRNRVSQWKVCDDSARGKNGLGLISADWKRNVEGLKYEFEFEYTFRTSKI